MSLKARLQDDMRTALRAGDKDRLGVLRMALAAVQRREVDTRQALDDAGVQAVLEKLVKQGEESATQYANGGRPDLADKETAEVAVLRSYLPEPLGAAELEQLIAAAIDATGASTPKDIGRVMQEIKSRAAGRVDLGSVSSRVREILAAD